jgi:hypothetical protein
MAAPSKEGVINTHIQDGDPANDCRAEPGCGVAEEMSGATEQ